MTMPVVHLEGVSFERKKRPILSNISWTIEPDQHWALLGANGSGKTSLLKILTGYEWPAQGIVEVLGHRLGECHLGRLRRTIGWVSSALTTQLPGRNRTIDIVVSGMDASLGLYRSFEKAEYDRAYTTLSAIGAECYAEQQYETLSQGEQQRALIARAMINRPRLLILDEPCVGLDPAARHQFLADLSQLAGNQDCPGIVYVTHHIEEIGPWIDQVMVLKGGRILNRGPAKQVLSGEVLSRAFDCVCQVERIQGQYQMWIHNNQINSV
ncbi:MAG: ABC transporter ATP-binding protein [Sedimentisphaerales bacterium]|nr:ABC transporter ATP-binding protein [Sedimentisphaerales bacterium]